MVLGTRGQDQGLAQHETSNEPTLDRNTVQAPTNHSGESFCWSVQNIDLKNSFPCAFWLMDPERNERLECLRSGRSTNTNIFRNSAK